ncbi:hypothetical protein BCR32DRAFT_273778 [Anaeromyces robustus]|uniref:Uncharacterized protein n=1 Tax=Anaeromyces robustus TaxID=1754192 RepID=A0A1Y1XRE1_9FUNG|nr:hypothetical protein BCR32DRAFT_273778 [Anaeromyces robustus]|eukprot:ORX88225.1 hypothetical protein BCR32DRAFT_273778 [Anaeromyces robustus]
MGNPQHKYYFNACKSRNKKIELGFNVTKESDSDFTPFHRSCIKTSLFKHGTDINTENEKSNTSMFNECKNNVRYYDKEGNIPLYMFFDKYSKICLFLLLVFRLIEYGTSID